MLQNRIQAAEHRFVRAGIPRAARVASFKALLMCCPRLRCRSSDGPQCMWWFGIDKPPCKPSEHDDRVDVNAAQQTLCRAPSTTPPPGTDDAHDRGADHDRPAHDDAHHPAPTTTVPPTTTPTTEAPTTSVPPTTTPPPRHRRRRLPPTTHHERGICPDHNCNGDTVELLPSSTPWGWIVLGILLVAGLVVALVLWLRSRSRRAALTAWRQSARPALQQAVVARDLLAEDEADVEPERREAVRTQIEAGSAST